MVDYPCFGVDPLCHLVVDEIRLLDDQDQLASSRIRFDILGQSDLLASLVIFFLELFVRLGDGLLASDDRRRGQLCLPQMADIHEGYCLEVYAAHS